MTTEEFIASLDEMKVVMTTAQYQYLMKEKAKITAIEIMARDGSLNSEKALRVITEGASKEDFE